MPTHVVYKGQHYELPVDGLTAEDALMRVRNLIGETGEGTALSRLQPGATAPQGFEDTSGDVQRILSEHEDPQNWKEMGRIGMATAEAGGMLAGLPGIVPRMLPKLLTGAATGAAGSEAGRWTGRQAGRAVEALGAPEGTAKTLEGAGTVVGGLAGGIGGAGVVDALARAPGKRVIGKLGTLALEAVDDARAARAMEAAKAASEVKAAETLAPAVSGEGAFAQTTTQPARVIGSIGKLPLQGAPAAYTDAGDAALAKVRQLMSMPGGKEAVREFLKTQPPEVALDLTKKLGRYAFSQ